MDTEETKQRQADGIRDEMLSDVVLETAVSPRGSLEFNFWNVSPHLGLEIQMSRSCPGLEVGKSRVNFTLRLDLGPIYRSMHTAISRLKL